MFSILKPKRAPIILPERSLEEIKPLTNILFIDDQTFSILDVLSKSGWQNIKRVKDVENLDHQDIQSSHIIFVDVRGVGKKLRFKDEGLDLIVALKTKYPHKKIILYSAHRNGDVFHKAFDLVDGRIPKNADLFVFLQEIEKHAKGMFLLPDLIRNLRQILNDHGVKMSEEQIQDVLVKVQEKGTVNVRTVNEYIKVTGSVLQLVSHVIAIYLQKPA